MLQNQVRSIHLIVHIGPEIVECLMRNANSAEITGDTPEEPSRVNGIRDGRLQRSLSGSTPWNADKLSTALFLALRWFF